MALAAWPTVTAPAHQVEDAQVLAAPAGRLATYRASPTGVPFHDGGINRLWRG
jgi:hypothetical protein